jgi:Phage integrase family
VAGDCCAAALGGKELRALRKLLRETPEGSRGIHVFVSERLAPLSVAGYQRMVARAGEATGFTFLVHSHMLRHSCGYKLANDGHDTRAIQHYLGHRSIASTGSVQGVLEGLSGPLEARVGKLDDRLRNAIWVRACGNRGASLSLALGPSSGDLNCRGSLSISAATIVRRGALKQRRPAKEAPGRQGRINKLTGKVSAVTRTQIQVIFAARGARPPRPAAGCDRVKFNLAHAQQAQCQGSSRRAG